MCYIYFKRLRRQRNIKKAGNRNCYQERINVWGEVTAHEIRHLTVDFPASVESVLVEEGDVVSQGEVLAVLSMEEFQAREAAIIASSKKLLVRLYPCTSFLLFPGSV